MATYKRRQSESLWVDIECTRTTEIHDTWFDWVGAWKLLDSAGVVVMSEELVRADTVGVFQLRLGPTRYPDFAALPEGRYALVYQFRCDAVDYDQEAEDLLVISAQKYL